MIEIALESKKGLSMGVVRTTSPYEISSKVENLLAAFAADAETTHELFDQRAIVKGNVVSVGGDNIIIGRENIEFLSA